MEPAMPPSKRILPGAQESLSDHGLELFLRENRPGQLIKTLFNHYKDADNCTRLRSNEHPRFPKRLAAKLHMSADPPGFIIDALCELSFHFRDSPNPSVRFERLLARMCTEALEEYVCKVTATAAAADRAADRANKLKSRRQPVEKKPKTNAAKQSSGAGAHTDVKNRALSHELMDAALFAMATSDVEIDVESNELDSLASHPTMTAPFEPAKDRGIVSSTPLPVQIDISRPTSVNQPLPPIITLSHQQRCLSLIPTIPSPMLLSIAITPFHLESLLSEPADPEPAGVTLIRRLFEHKSHHDAIFAIKLLGLERFFSVQQIIVPLLEANNLQEVIHLCKNDETKRVEFLEFVNAQLSHLFVGGLEVVTDDMIASVSPQARALAPMRRLYDRPFQRDITNAAFRIIQDYSLPLSAHPFIKLGRQYAILRWLLRLRAAQQEVEGDRSAAACENFDSMLEYLLVEQPVLTRLAVRKLVNMEDEEGARRVACKFGIEGFLDSYITTPEDRQRIGQIPVPLHKAVKSPQNSYETKKAQRAAANKLELYVMPAEVEIRFVSNREELAKMTEALRGAEVCGMDTEWLPDFLIEDRNPRCTAIMQIACDNGVVFLMDMVALIGEREGQVQAEENEGPGQDVNIRQETESVLKEFFEDENVLKIGYEFKGDRTLLARSFPILSSSLTQLRNFLDFNNVYAQVDDPKNPTADDDNNDGDAPNMLDSNAPNTSDSNAPNTSDSNAPNTSDSKALGDRISGGLAGLVAHYVKKKLDKKQQLSNWERRPLSDQQIMYAASDAYSLIEVYRVLRDEKHPILATAMNSHLEVENNAP